jgi:hypothetical protein
MSDQTLKDGQPDTYAPKERLNKAMTPVNKCHRCGATSYKPVIKRDEAGTMKPSGEFQCVGCKLLFTDIDTWKNGPTPLSDASLPQHPSQ